MSNLFPTAARTTLNGQKNFSPSVDIMAVTLNLVPGRPVLCWYGGRGYFQNSTSANQVPWLQPYVAGTGVSTANYALPAGQETIGSPASRRLVFHTWLILPSELPAAGGSTVISLRDPTGDGDNTGSSYYFGDVLVWNAVQL